MIAQLQRALLYALFQLSIATGIALMPAALVARRAGIPFPVHRVLKPLQSSLDEESGESIS